MTIKLDKRDIEGVASSRYWRGYRKRLIGVGLVVLGSFLISLGVSPCQSDLPTYLLLALLALSLGYVAYLAKGQGKAIRKLVEQWKKEGVS